MSPIATANTPTPAKADSPKISQNRGLYRAWIVWALRIIVGAVFIFSGVTKAIDPWGFIFKIEEYLALWGVDMPRNVILVGAIGLSLYEFDFGLMLMSGSLRRTAPWFLLISMAVMLPLTGYIAFNGGVSDCGCFGDALHLSNGLTFVKNLILTVFLVYLCCFNRRVRQGLYNPAIQWLVGVLATVYILLLCLGGYNIQPLLDFRSFPVGTDMESIIDGENDDLSDYKYKYVKNGEEKIFGADELPDESWEFVDVVSPASSGLLTRQFTVYDGDEDVTNDLITGEGELLLLIIPEPKSLDISYSYYANEFDSYMRRHGGEMVGLLGGNEEAISRWYDLSMAQYPCYSVDDTTLKELSRGSMSLVYLKDGDIRWKRTMASLDYNTIEKIGADELSLDELDFRGKRIFIVLTSILVAALSLIALFQRAIISLVNVFRKKYKKTM